MAVSFINCFEVPKGREEDFLKAFEQVNALMRRQPGYVSHRLHRAVGEGARFRFINYVLWETPEACLKAHASAEFLKLVALPEWKEFSANPGIYEVVHEAGTSAIASA